MTSPTAEQQAKLEIYPRTVLEFVDGPRIDLRRPITAESLAGLRRLGLDRPFAVITAENPCGMNREESGSELARIRHETRNAIRVTLFETELARRGIFFRVLDGASPDGRHRERSVAAAMPRHEAERVARELDQLAIFWFDGQRFWLVPVAAAGDARPLPADGGTD